MKKLVSFLLAALLLLACVSCGGSGGKLADIQKKGTLQVITDPNFPPFEFHGKSGVEGVDMEIAKAIAAELGVTLEISEGEFDSIIMGIKGGKGDIAISGFTITEERQKSVDFSKPYINSVQYLILMDGSTLKTVEDLSGKKVGVAAGYTGSLLIDGEINDEEGVLYGTDTTFTEYPSAMEATLDMKNGKVDAVIMDEFVAKSIAAATDGVFASPLSYADGALAAEEYGVVVSKGNKDLVDKINSVLDKLIADGKIEAWVLQYGA